jgi:hypothetical protein
MNNSTAIVESNQEQTDVTEPLTQHERELLASCEKTIDANVHTFVKVGEALRAIRDGRLYRGTHGTFERYCRERWELGRAHAYRLIGASETMAALSPKGDILPATESQVRPLLQFDLADRPKVWADVCTRLGTNVSPGLPRTVNAIVQSFIDGSSDEPYCQHRKELQKERKEKRRRAEERHEQQVLEAHGPEETPLSGEEFAQLGDIASKLDKAFARAKRSYDALAISDDHAVGHLMFRIQVAVTRLNEWIAEQSESKEAA